MGALLRAHPTPSSFLSDLESRYESVGFGSPLKVKYLRQSCAVIPFLCFAECSSSAGWEIVAIVAMFWCICVDCEPLYLYSNTAKSSRLCNGSSYDWNCHFAHVPKVIFFATCSFICISFFGIFPRFSLIKFCFSCERYWKHFICQLASCSPVK